MKTKHFSMKLVISMLLAVILVMEAANTHLANSSNDTETWVK